VHEAPEPPATEVAPERPRGRKRRWLTRWTRRLLALVVAIVAAALVSTFTIDLGPFLKGVAERQGSNFLKRPLHIGRLSAMLSPGEFALDDVVIEGRHPGDRPFFSAGRIRVRVPWWTLFRKRLIVEVTLDDWRMVVERWPDGHNIPNLKPKGGSGKKPWFTTTVPFVYARQGQFIYDDHVVPWSVNAPNLNFELVRSEVLRQYVGEARFSGGAVAIQSYQPMATSMQTRFVLDGPMVRLQHIDLVTDGSTSHINGTVDFGNWPVQTYNVNSDVDFERMRQIFFAHESWRVGGTGTFTGIFQMTKNGRYDLSGEFASDAARLNDLPFEDLHGALVWNPDRFAVTHADADVLGGATRLEYGLAPLGTPHGATATFTADYTNLDLLRAGQLINLRGLQLAGRASGSLSMEWPNGHFSAGRRGEGHTIIAGPPGVDLASAALPETPRPVQPEPEPFDGHRPMGPLAVGGDIDYHLDSGGWQFDPGSWAATPYTYVRFEGRLASSGSSDFPFHVTSHDWQESDRVLAGVMTALSGPTGAIQIGGRGTFDGRMTGSFSAPRIAGRFAGEGTRVWDVTWGHAEGDAVIQGGYVDISNAHIGSGARAIVPAGRFALGYRANSADEEIHATVRLANWPMADLRHAFSLDDWPVDGVIGTAALDLTGRYRNMFGTGAMRIDNGVAWGEHFESATGDLDLEGTGIRVHRIVMKKGPGLVRGEARVGWDGTYAFNADGEDIPVERLDNFQFPRAPLSGRLQFTASGAS
jgi:hypothetical protein